MVFCDRSPGRAQPVSAQCLRLCQHRIERFLTARKPVWLASFNVSRNLPESPFRWGQFTDGIVKKLCPRPCNLKHQRGITRALVGEFSSLKEKTDSHAERYHVRSFENKCI